MRYAAGGALGADAAHAIDAIVIPDWRARPDTLRATRRDLRPCGAGLRGLPAEAARAMVGITVTSFGIALGIGIIFPLVPVFARDLGISITAVGSLVGAFGVARIAIGFFGGEVFSRASEGAVAAVGAATVAVGSLLTAYATDFTDLLVARVVHGLGRLLFVVAGLIYIGRAMPATHRGRMMGLHQGSMLLATSIGPVVGASLAELWRRAPSLSGGRRVRRLCVRLRSAELPLQWLGGRGYVGARGAAPGGVAMDLRRHAHRLLRHLGHALGHALHPHPNRESVSATRPPRVSRPRIRRHDTQLAAFRQSVRAAPCWL